MKELFAVLYGFSLLVTYYKQIMVMIDQMRIRARHIRSLAAYAYENGERNPITIIRFVYNKHVFLYDLAMGRKNEIYIE